MDNPLYTENTESIDNVTVINLRPKPTTVKHEQKYELLK